MWKASDQHFVLADTSYLTIFPDILCVKQHFVTTNPPGRIHLVFSRHIARSIAADFCTNEFLKRIYIHISNRFIFSIYWIPLPVTHLQSFTAILSRPVRSLEFGPFTVRLTQTFRRLNEKHGGYIMTKRIERGLSSRLDQIDVNPARTR